MRTTIKWYNTQPGIADLPVGTRMYWLRPVGGDCDQDRAVFNALTTRQKIDQSTTTEPDSATGFVVRTCGGGPVTDSVDVSAPNSEWQGGSTPPPTVEIVPPVAGDPASYGQTSAFTYS